MFAVELEFEDGVSQPEIILVRRPQFVIGVSDRAHVVVDGMASCDFELQLVRGIGRSFSYQSLRREDRPEKSFKELKGIADSEGSFRLGEVTVRVKTLDLDLVGLVTDENPNNALSRLLNPSHLEYPALVVFGTAPMAFSLPPRGSILIGRSRACAIRLDAADISAEHCRVTVTSEGVSIIDLESKNGTWIGEEKLQSERILRPGELVRVGGGTVVTLVRDRKDYQDISKQIPERSLPESLNFDEFPRLFSTSDDIKPQRLVLKQNQKISLGRDPSNDIWINVPHISRRHVEVMLLDSTKVELTDLSSNGTYVRSSRLTAEKPTIFELTGPELVLDLTGGVSIALQVSEPLQKAKVPEPKPKKLTIKPPEPVQEHQIPKESSIVRNDFDVAASEIDETAVVREPIRPTDHGGMFVSEDLEQVDPELPEYSPWLRYFLFGAVFMVGGTSLFLIVSLLFDRSFY